MFSSLLLFALATYTLIPLHNTELTSVNFQRCRQFFVDNTPPSGFRFNVKSVHKGICQDYNGNRPHIFATLYDSNLRIPMYSAYILENGNPGPRPPFIEDDDLTRSHYPQAADADYLNNEKFMDRGHLAPRQYFAGGRSDATFLLTNIVPQNRDFNTGIWNNREDTVKNLMERECEEDNAYFITGVIPGKKSLGENKVNIPRYLYTATCCLRRINVGDKPFSLAFFGKNTNNPTVEYMDVTALEDRVKNELGLPNEIKFFKRAECNKSDQRIMRNLMNNG